MLKLKMIITSTRPGRKGPAVAQPFFDIAAVHPGFETELVDLAEMDLPLLDEPHHPRLQQYTKEHTKRWSALIDGADAFIFVLPEYNFSFPATVKNALDYLAKEWSYKPVGFISYGGMSGGLRAVDVLLPVIRAFKMVALVEGVHIAGFPKHFNAEGKFIADETMQKAMHTMLAELQRWAEALKPLREKK
ncbi:MAG TPA: NAD(P)H-dependent oxidoreductase [Bacteroidia bacterium]|nr:NAD(P)H-dependent oxidoreductase [Bacteroidia bacterium]